MIRAKRWPTQSRLGSAKKPSSAQLRKICTPCEEGVQVNDTATDTDRRPSQILSDTEDDSFNGDGLAQSDYIEPGHSQRQKKSNKLHTP